MRLNKFGRFSDEYRGNGWFVSWFIRRGYVLLAVRPMNWAFRFAHPALQPWVKRIYIGPFEFELSWFEPGKSY